AGLGMFIDSNVNVSLSLGSANIPNTTPVPLTSWSHIAVTYDGTNAKIFVNGVGSANLSFSGHSSGISTHDVSIGTDSIFSATSFNGAIDEIRVSNNIRYTSNFVPSGVRFTSDANTLGLWHLDEGTGLSVADASGTFSNGTLSGASPPTWVPGNFTTVSPSVLSDTGILAHLLVPSNTNNSSVLSDTA